MKKMNVFWCKSCISMSTRPRITFDQRGFCSACQWMEQKQKIDWSKRQEKLEKLLGKHRAGGRNYDCIIAVSGGKDGSYASYKLKHEHNMNPLTVTFRPILETEIGKKNLESFINSGYDHVHITPDQEAMRVLNKIGFTDLGFPYYGWLMGIHTAVLKLAMQMNIPLIFYSEDGEVEYGGDAKHKDNAIKLLEYMVSDEAQNFFANSNYEFPVRSDIALSETLTKWRTSKFDDIHLTKVGAGNKAAVITFDKAGWK